MASQTNYYSSITEPKLTSVEERSLSLMRTPKDLVVRAIDLTGVPVRINIDGRLKKVYFRTNNKSAEIKEFLDKKYLPLFKDMMNSFFCSSSYLYGVIVNKKLFIYDIFVNSNWFSYEDLISIRDDYKYGKEGFEILEPIAVMNFSVIEAFKFMTHVFESDKSKVGKVHLIPYYTIVSSANYAYQGDLEWNGFGTAETEELLYSNYVAPTASTTGSTIKDYYGDGFDYDETYGSYSGYWNKDKKKEDENKGNLNRLDDSISIDEMDLLFPVNTGISHPCYKLTKVERTQLYRTAYSNLREYWWRKFKVQPAKSDDSIIKTISYLWGIWSSKMMRDDILLFLRKKENMSFVQALLENKPKGYANIFLALWHKYNKPNITRLSSEAKTLFNTEYVAKLLNEEFAYFDAIFYKELLVQ